MICQSAICVPILKKQKTRDKKRKTKKLKENKTQIKINAKIK